MSKRIGILGGLSYESTIYYYEKINKKYYADYKNFNYPEIVIFSLEFQKLIDFGNSKNDEEYFKYLITGISSLENAGADFIIIASNAPHTFYDKVKAQTKVPIISIAEVTAEEARNQAMKKVLLLGTKLTMQSTFYQTAFQKYGIEIVAPKEDEQLEIDRIIFDELVVGTIKEESKNKLLEIISNYEVDGVILGCTELPLLINQSDTDKKLLDTADLHTTAALKYALN
jgi:aspartate racemase